MDSSFYFCLIPLMSFFYEVLAELLSAIKMYRLSVVVCKALYRKSN